MTAPGCATPWRLAADLVVLDLNMPGENGFSLDRWLREHHDFGILMLTGADTAFDTVAGLEVGADAYLSKPFALAELEGRIAAVLRRRRPKTADSTLAAGCLAFGSYVFDPKSRSLADGSGAIVPLTPWSSTSSRYSRHMQARFLPVTTSLISPRRAATILSTGASTVA
jgi:DNA-binding response OmpR family regulator